MTVGAHEALNQVLIAHLRNASPLWGVKVQPLEIASSNLEKPYVVFFPASNGRFLGNANKKRAQIVMSIKGVAKDMASALAIQEAITGLLDDSGSQDISPRLPYHAGWVVTTVTEDRAIWLQEQFAGAENIYHAGHQYQVNMERRNG
jgi:hypothetical protein